MVVDFQYKFLEIENMKKRRVVITGLGVITPIGIGKKAFWKALTKGKSGIRRITRFDVSSYSSQIAGEVDGFDPTDYMDPKSVKRMDRFSQFALACAKMAVEDSKLKIDQKNKEKIGVVLGSGLGGLSFGEEQHSIFMEKGLRRTSPFLALNIFAGAAASNIAIEMGVSGYNNTLSTACSTGSDAIGHAVHIIHSDLADTIISGGAEAPLAPLCFGSFCTARALSSHKNNTPEKASRPFDKDRDGFVMSEGAGILILEELSHALKRNAPIYAEVIGYGTTCDAYHMTKPLPSGEHTARAIKLAIKDADIKPEEISYFKAHGTSTVLNDKVETKVIKDVFGKHAYKLPI
ncbi:MAG: beta-ketoacyl-ACP synthase II, partial [Thermodesulfobacteriota bacterium]|nr:beta-ketoacyl-ACP synthase II [Thermodesulfobacteriota bacterium]